VEDLYPQQPVVSPVSSVLADSHRPESVNPVPLHLIQLDKTYKKFCGVMEADRPSSLDEAYMELDDLVEEIRETSKALQDETPSSLTDENKKIVGNLQARKRKAFADLLKALRGLGFSAKNRADQLANQSSSAWLCNLPGLLEESKQCIPEIQSLLRNSESYHHRLDILLPDMRESLRNHSEDFVTQDLQRAHGFADNVFGTALNYRSRFVCYWFSIALATC
jgi:midasin